MRSGRSAFSLRASSWVPLAAAAVSFAVHAETACRTIRWWDGSSYPLAAVTLGVTAAPGSVMLTWIGWLASRFAIVTPVAFQLNLVAVLIAAVLVALVTRLAIELAADDPLEPDAADVGCALAAGLALAFSVSVWSYAMQFTPYILSACWTAVLLTLALAWWRRARDDDATPQLFALFVAFGLDFSVHRTNTLLLPAALLMVLLRRPRVLARVTNLGAIAGGLLLGLSPQLLLIPMARRNPALNIDDPRDLQRLWEYFSLEGRGGGFLIRLYPRTADFVHVQLRDIGSFFARNLRLAAPGPLGWLPVALALVGLTALFRTERRRGLAVVGFLLCASLGAVVYFNLPANYFRSMDRHYLPALVIVAPVLAVGARALFRLAARLSTPLRFVALGVLGPCVTLLSTGGWLLNQRTSDLSRVRYTEGLSRAVLQSLPPRTILFTNGDNDTFPLWYLQEVEHVRRDVTVINLPCATTGWYLAQLRRRDPDLGDLLASHGGEGLVDTLALADTTITIAVDPAAERAPGASGPAVLRVQGTLQGAERVVLDLIERNRWRRPVHAATTVTRDWMPWLWPRAQFAGWSFAFMPDSSFGISDIAPLKQALMGSLACPEIEDPDIPMDDTDRAMCGNAVAGLMSLASAQLATDPHGALETIHFLEQHYPPARLGWPMDALAQIRGEAKRRLGR